MQGPFTAENLKSWNTQGYLYPELECTDSAESQAFFPFSALSELWSLEEKLGLKPEDVQKLADAEMRLRQAATQQPAHVHQPAHQPELGDQPAPFSAVDTMASQYPSPSVDNQLATARDGGLDAPPLDQRSGRGETQVKARQVQPSPVSKQQSTLYDPIDDIIDEGPRNVVKVPPGERTLQPFTMGMEMGAPAAPAAAVAPQFAAPGVGPTGAQQADLPDTMENMHIANVPATTVPSGRTKVNPSALFGEPTPMQSVAQGAAPKGNNIAEPVTSQRIVPAQLFAQFSNARDAHGPANGHAPPDTMTPQQLVPPPAPPPRSAAPQVAATSRPTWGVAQPVRPAKFDEIQAEEIHRRKQEVTAAQVAAKSQMAQVEAEHARRAAWAAQPKPVNFRQIVEDDEECAADLEGGWCAPPSRMLFAHCYVHGFTVQYILVLIVPALSDMHQLLLLFTHAYDRMLARVGRKMERGAWDR